MRVIESEFSKSVRGRGVTGGTTGVPESSTMVYPSRQAVLTDDIFEDPKSEDMKVISKMVSSRW